MNRRERRAAAQHSSPPASPPRRETSAAWFEAGLRLLKAGQLAEAEKCGRSALALDEGHADSLHLMGLLCMASRNYDLAIEWFAVAIRQNPQVADYFTNLGTALNRKSRAEEAIRSFDRALVLPSLSKIEGGLQPQPMIGVRPSGFLQPDRHFR